MRWTKCPVRVAVDRFVIKLIFARIYQAHYEWRNHMHKLDTTMGNPDQHWIYLTNFGAMLDLRIVEKDNCLVNNHAVIFILFVVTNWRRVLFTRNTKYVQLLEDETIVNDCAWWIFLCDTLSKVKNNDHVFHIVCLAYINTRYDEDQRREVKEIISCVSEHTYIWLTQYKYRQNFIQVAKFILSIDHHPIVVYKFAQKYRFKGSNAFEYYKKLSLDLTKDGKE